MSDKFDPIRDAFAVSTWLVFMADRFPDHPIKQWEVRIGQAVDSLRALDAENKQLRAKVEEIRDNEVDLFQVACDTARTFPRDGLNGLHRFAAETVCRAIWARLQQRGHDIEWPDDLHYGAGRMPVADLLPAFDREAV